MNFVESPLKNRYADASAGPLDPSAIGERQVFDYEKANDFLQTTDEQYFDHYMQHTDDSLVEPDPATE